MTLPSLSNMQVFPNMPKNFPAKLQRGSLTKFFKFIKVCMAMKVQPFSLGHLSIGLCLLQITV